MGYIVFITLMIVYALGLKVFQATGPVHVLPFAAIAALIVDFWLARRARSKK